MESLREEEEVKGGEKLTCSKNLCYYRGMTTRSILTAYRDFQKSPAKSALRRGYFGAFEKRMVYRTTKSENPELTMKAVNTIFQKFRMKEHGSTSR